MKEELNTVPDAYANQRSIPLLTVLNHLGFNEWKTRKKKGQTEYYGRYTNLGPIAPALVLRVKCFIVSLVRPKAVELSTWYESEER